MKTLAISFKIFLVFTVLTGIIYPLLVTGIAQVVFPHQANGSLIVKDNIIIGSKLIGQQFDSIIYFSSRPSAIRYSPIPSGASNLGPTSSKLKAIVDERKSAFLENNQLDKNTEIPSEMLFASASGLDPHISPEAVDLQINRIVQARSFSTDQKQKLIQLVEKLIEKPQLTLLGESRVNVLLLNLQLDEIK